jgi:hypothetical protein
MHGNTAHGHAVSVSLDSEFAHNKAALHGGYEMIATSEQVNTTTFSRRVGCARSIAVGQQVHTQATVEDPWWVAQAQWHACCVPCVHACSECVEHCMHGVRTCSHCLHARTERVVHDHDQQTAHSTWQTSCTSLFTCTTHGVNLRRRTRRPLISKHLPESPRQVQSVVDCACRETQELDLIHRQGFAHLVRRLLSPPFIKPR